MTYVLDEAGKLKLPVDAAKWTIADLGIKGSGKSYAACDFAEELIGQGIPIIVIDPLGIHWGLRVGVDSNGDTDPAIPGLPIVIFGGRHADIPLPLIEVAKKKQRYQQLDEDKLKLLVKSILESGISAVLDVSGLSNNLQRRIVAQFVYEVMRQYEFAGGYGVRHFFIEEADTFSPQRLWSQDESMNSLGAISKLVKQGGNFNLGCTLITQRPAVLNKDVLTQCSCLFVFRILHKIDKDAVKTWVESMADPKAKAIIKWYDGLKELKNGEGWVWHPEPPNEIFTEIKFRRRHTLHATREYFEVVGRTPIKLTNIDDYIGKFQKVFTPPTPPVKAPPPPRNFPTPNPIGTTAPPAPFVEATFPKASVVEVPQDKVGFAVARDRLGFNLPSDLQPATCFGRLLVVLKQGTDSAGNKKWSISGMLRALGDHGWEHSEEEVRQVVEDLLKTEILTIIYAGTRPDYKFTGASRVRLVDRIREVPVGAVCLILGGILTLWYLHLWPF